MPNIRKSPRTRQQKASQEDKIVRALLTPVYKLKPILPQPSKKFKLHLELLKAVLLYPLWILWSKIPKRNKAVEELALPPTKKKVSTKKEISRFDIVFNIFIGVFVLIFVTFLWFFLKDPNLVTNSNYTANTVSATATTPVTDTTQTPSTTPSTTAATTATTTTQKYPKYPISNEDFNLLVLAVQHEIGYNADAAITLYWVDASDSQIMNWEISEENLEEIPYDIAIQAMTKIILNNMRKHNNLSLKQEFKDPDVWETMHEDILDADTSKYNIQDPVTRKNIQIVLDGLDNLPENMMAEMSMQPEKGECGMNLHDSWKEFREYFYPEYIKCTIYGKNSWDGGWWIAAEELSADDVDE